MRTIPGTTSLLAAALAAAVLSACNDSSGPTNKGALAVNVTAPAGVAGAVAVSGPDAYSKMVTATSTLNNLTPGTYNIVADTAFLTDSVVGAYINTGVVTGSPATVVAHATSNATVTYTQVGRRGGLWIANNGGGINNSTIVAEFAAAQLHNTGSVTLAPADTIGGLAKTGGVAIDAAGNLWVASYDLNTIEMYTPAQRTGGGAPTPTVTITSASLGDPEQLAFDANGTLWVADYQNGLIGFTKTQLAATGSVTATYVITDTSSSNSGTYAVAFDASGNAWVAASLGNRLSKYSASQLAASGSPVPVATLTDTLSSLDYPSALAFDASGNLWVANDGYRDSTIVRYSASQLASGGQLIPSVTILIPGVNGNYGNPFGIAVDNRGTVWVADADNSVIDGFLASQVTTSGAPTPSIVLGTTGDAIDLPEQLVFDPYAPAPAPIVVDRAPRASIRSIHRSGKRMNGAGATR